MGPEALLPIVGCSVIECATCSTLTRAGNLFFRPPTPGPMSAQVDD